MKRSFFKLTSSVHELARSRYGAAPSGAAAPADSLPASAIMSLLGRLIAQVQVLQPGSLAESEVRSLSGSLFVGGPLLVRAVALALTARPALFPEGRARAARMLAHQGRASALLYVKTAVERFLRRVSDGHLAEQSAANREAQEVVEEARQARLAADGTRSPAEIQAAREQTMALRAAFSILRHRNQKKRRVMLRNRRQRGQPPPQRRRRSRQTVSLKETLAQLIALHDRRRRDPAMRATDDMEA